MIHAESPELVISKPDEVDPRPSLSLDDFNFLAHALAELVTHADKVVDALEDFEVHVYAHASMLGVVLVESKDTSVVWRSNIDALLEEETSQMYHMSHVLDD